MAVNVYDKNCRKNIVMIIYYGPNEDDLIETKDEFYEILSNVLHGEDEDILTFGDLNGRVDITDGFEKDIGLYRESEINSNGKR